MIETRLKLALAVMVLAGACHRGAATMQREQKNYQVVPEGQASGVSSTINAPGEIPPPMTNTSADTTSNFTLAPNVDTTGTAPGTISATLPGTVTAAPVRTMAPAQPQQSRVIITNTNSQPPPRKKLPPSDEPSPPSQTDTSATTEQPPPTDTTATEKKSDDDQPSPPPPPPTQTDTRGW